MRVDKFLVHSRALRGDIKLAQNLININNCNTINKIGEFYDDINSIDQTDTHKINDKNEYEI